MSSGDGALMEGECNTEASVVGCLEPQPAGQVSCGLPLAPAGGLHGQASRTRKRGCCVVDLYVGPSRIQGANLGLFTRTRLPKGTCLGYYTGTVLPEYPAACDLCKFRNGDYLMDIRRRPPWLSPAEWQKSKRAGVVLVDGTCLLSKANCCKGDAALGNCDVRLTGAFVTNRALQEGEEVIVNYGPYYWEGQ